MRTVSLTPRSPVQTSSWGAEMPTKRERLERRVKVAIAAGVTLWMLHVFHDANVYAYR